MFPPGPGLGSAMSVPGCVPGPGQSAPDALAPLIPATAGIRMADAGGGSGHVAHGGNPDWIWIPAFAGMSGGKWTSVFAVRFRDGDGEVGGAWAIARNRCDPLLSRYGDR